MPTSYLHNICGSPSEWRNLSEGRFCYFSGILDCRIWLSGRKCQFWETCEFLGERTELLIVTESAPPSPQNKSLCSLHQGWYHERLTY
jgi:hypothetical protein